MIESPIFLRNLAYLLSGGRRSYCERPSGEPKTKTDYLEDIGILRQFKPNFERWIAENRVAGNPRNERIVRRGLRLYTKMADFSALSCDHAASDLRDFTARVKGLLATPKMAPRAVWIVR